MVGRCCYYKVSRKSPIMAYKIFSIYTVITTVVPQNSNRIYIIVELYSSDSNL